jgi:NADH-quinone oxidoreductase subunit G
MNQSAAVIDGVTVPIRDERNLLELIRKTGTELPTFCYHSDISVYGACRMCMVFIQGRGIVPACSTKAEDGMVVKTNTKQIQAIRRVIVELMLANHDQNCTLCPKSGECRLQSIAKQMGVSKIRFNKIPNAQTVDTSSDAILRDPGKCILCGDCVRVCEEIQSVGALDFAYRGAETKVVTCFNRHMGEIECVNCGQCIKACPVGALTPKNHIGLVWDAIYDPEKTVVVQIAPAVRVAIGEYFGKDPGALIIGKMISALRRMGFDNVYDTCFGADFTVVEEGKEFLARKAKGENLPLFTSCCPAWVKFAEQYYPDLLSNLSSCRSPQQMFGALCKERLTKDLNIPRENLVVVSIMPCTAKKFEAGRPEFRVNGNPDVDIVLTTNELAVMMKQSGLNLDKLDLDSFDMPFGFSTGASVIFGSSGGVSEAVLRFAADALERGSAREFRQFRGGGGLKVFEIRIGGNKLRLGVVSGLANARRLIDKVRRGEEQFDLIEVMACRGGCVNGGGQPAGLESEIAERAKGLYDSDRMLQFHVSSENPYLQQIYADDLDARKAHGLLHTGYENRKRINREDFVLNGGGEEKQLSISICFGTSCYLRGAQNLYNQITTWLRENALENIVEFKANFCGKRCGKGPMLKVNEKQIERCTLETAVTEIEKALKG